MTRRGPAAGNGDARPRPLRMLAVTAAWGGCFVAIRYGLADAPLLWFAGLRATGAGAVLLVVAAARRQLRLPRASWPALAVLAVVNVTVAFAAMFAGTAGVPTGVAAVLANAQPLLIVLPAWVFYSERPTGRLLAGIGVGFAGLVVAASGAGVGGRGALLSLAAAVAITAGTLLTRQLRGVDAVTATAWQFTAGGLLLLGWAAATEGTPSVHWTARFTVALLVLTLVGTVLPYLWWFVEVQRAPLAALSAWTLLTPAFGVGFGFVLLDERLSGRQLLGVGLVVSALALTAIRRRARGGSTASGSGHTDRDACPLVATVVGRPAADPRRTAR